MVSFFVDVAVYVSAVLAYHEADSAFQADLGVLAGNEIMVAGFAEFALEGGRDWDLVPHADFAGELDVAV